MIRIGHALAGALLLAPALVSANAAVDAAQTLHRTAQAQLRALAAGKPLPKSAPATDPMRSSDPAAVGKQAEVERLLRWLSQLDQTRAKQLLPDVAPTLLALQGPGAAGGSCQRALSLHAGQPAQRIRLASQGDAVDHVWLRWQAGDTDAHLLSTRGSDLDTRLQVYTDCADSGSAAKLDNDDAFGLNAELALRPEYRGQVFYVRAENLSKSGDLNIGLGDSVPSISGRVVDEDTGAPLANVQVLAAQVGDSYGYLSGYSDADGNYTIGLYQHVEGTRYRVRTLLAYGAPGVHVQEIWPDQPCIVPNSNYFEDCAGGQEVIVDSQGIANGIDFALGHGGSIAGRVIDAVSLEPIEGAYLHLQHAYDEIAVATTDASGRYRVDGLATADYRLSATHNGYQTQVHAGLDCVENCGLIEGDMVRVEDSETDLVDFELLPHSFIEVEISVDGQPSGQNFPWTQFQISYPNGALVQQPYADQFAPGHYRLGPLDPGSYVVRAQIRNYTFAGLYPGVGCESDCEAEFDQAEAVTIAAIGDRPQIAINLQPYPALGGRVTDAAGGNVTYNTQVRLYDPSRPDWPVDYTNLDNDGDYRFDHVAPGRYFVHVTSAGYRDQISTAVPCESSDPLLDCPTASALTFSRSSGDQVLDFALQRSPRTRIVPRLSGNALPPGGYFDYSSVLLQDAQGNRLFPDSLILSEGGSEAELTDLDEGDYRVAIGLNGFFPVLYPSSPCPLSLIYGRFEACDFSQATLVSLGAADVELQFDLLPQGSRRVRVLRNGDDVPLAGVSVDIWDSLGRPLGNAVSGIDGVAMVQVATHLAPEPMPTRLSTDNYLGLRDQVYDNLQCPTGVSVYRGGCSLAGGTTVMLPEADPAAAEIVIRLQRPGQDGPVFESGFE